MFKDILHAKKEGGSKKELRFADRFSYPIGNGHTGSDTATLIFKKETLPITVRRFGSHQLHKFAKELPIYFHPLTPTPPPPPIHTQVLKLDSRGKLSHS